MPAGEPYDPRGFKAKCMRCDRSFYIAWETMCDAGICDECVDKRPPTAAPPQEKADDA